MIYVTPREAQVYLKDDQVVVLPTETVYGLAANGCSDAAIAQIYAIKNRPAFNPLIMHYFDVARVQEHVVWNALAESLAQAFWPGPLTLVLPRCPKSPLSLLACAGLETVAVRVPAHFIMREILEALPFPLAAPSANPSEQLSPTRASHVMEAFRMRDVQPAYMVDGGACVVGLESTVVDVTGERPVLLRPGVLTVDQMRPVVGDFAPYDAAGPIKSPGQTLRHYAPRKPLRLNVTDPLPGEGYLAFGPTIAHAFVYQLSASGDLIEAAANLFASLHEMDQDSRFQRIAVGPIPMQGLGIAINDRLGRAATHEFSLAGPDRV